MNDELTADKMADIIPEPYHPEPNTKCCGSACGKLSTFDWLKDFPEMQDLTKMVEVQFKNTRKGYFLNSNNIDLNKGDLVAVEALPGHDVGIVTLTGKLVEMQMRKNHYRPDEQGVRRVYRIARTSDLEKFEQAKAAEHPTMLRSRELAEELGLQMKIGDVEYQGDGNKAIFYYIADDRVDFRQLIKVLANEFKVKIEMKQIGARQEAGRIGGVGPCGRQLCCSGWMTNFVSVSTSAARYQDLSINPQKLAGQCAKLKCCLNYEVDMYVESQKKMPSREIVLQTKDSDYYHFKTDILSGDMTYSTDKFNPVNLVTISKNRVFEIISMNKHGKKPERLDMDVVEQKKAVTAYQSDILHDESITRFDSESKNKKRKKKKPQRKPSLELKNNPNNSNNQNKSPKKENEN